MGLSAKSFSLFCANFKTFRKGSHMEKQKVLDYSNVFIACYFANNSECLHANKEHTLIYLCSGILEITEHGNKHILNAGEYAFMRRDHRMIMQKHIQNNMPYRSIVLKFSRKFLREFYQSIIKKDLPKQAKRDERSFIKLPADRPDIKSLFESIQPFFDSGAKPSEDLLKLKMTEGMYVLLHTDANLYASLFDFTDPWKIDLLEYMNENYMYDLSLEEMAADTGRSLSSFKRDFKKVSILPPQKWIIKRRLEAAHELIVSGKYDKVTDVCYQAGFKNLSHFSRSYKEMYGCSPAANNRQHLISGK